MKLARILLVLVVFLCFLRADAAPCPPTADISGDPDEAAAVIRILAQRGISTTPTPDCPLTKARVLRVEGQIFIEIEDPLGRLSRRIVSNDEAAATVIESWVYDALGALRFDIFSPPEATDTKAPEALLLDDTFSPPLVVSPLPPMTAPPLPELISSPKDTMRLSLHSPDTRFSLFTELAFAGNGAFWYGVALRFFSRLGPFQVGLLGRISHRSALKTQQTPASSSVPRGAQSDCSPVDTNGDGIIDFLDCGNGCFLLDSDQDGALDDRRCQDDALNCVTIDINNDGTIDEFQCQPPDCQAGSPCSTPVEALRNHYSLQGEIGLPLQLGKIGLSPGIAAGLGQRWGSSFGASPPFVQAEAFLGLSRPLTRQTTLALRLSFSASPQLPEGAGQSAVHLSCGLSWGKQKQ